jgi:UDP-galactopyranose mutase
VGVEIYEKFIKGYTEKQWGRPASELPASIIKRLPIRLSESIDYFEDSYQGIPVGGYTAIFEKLLSGIHTWLGVDYFSARQEIDVMGRYLLYTGPIYRFFDYRFGRLEYRSLRFETQRIETKDFQDVAVVNYTDAAVPHTRIIEHKHFDLGQQNVTWISYEFPTACSNMNPPYYPVKDTLSQQRLEKYKKLSLENKYSRCFIGGRLGEYQYYDMHQVIAAALKLVPKIYEKCKVMTR